MASQSLPKMSLEAMYDDLCRYTKVLTAGNEKEFIIFAEGQKNLMSKLKEDAATIDELNKKIIELNNDKKKAEYRMIQMKSLLEAEVIKKRKLEMEKDSMERQISIIKEVLFAEGNNMDNQTKEKLFFLSSTTCKQPSESQKQLTTIEESIGSLLSPSDCDETDDDIEMNMSRRRKRRSKPSRRSSGDRSQKKKKSEENIETLSEEIEEAFRMDTNMPGRKVVNFRSSSEPHSNSPDMPTPKPVTRSDSDQVMSNKIKYDHLRKSRTLSTGTLPGSTPTGRYSTGGKLSRTHAFVSKTIIRPNEKCYPCGTAMGYLKKALKCSDCRINCHPKCKDMCPLPCIPVTFTPTKGIMGTLADYTSSTGPMIPSLIVQCVNEIETRGLKEIGLYRVPGSEREVKDLKEKLLKRHNVSLHLVEVHVLCGTIKDFLRSLRDSIVSRMMWHAFVDAAEHRDVELSLNLLREAVKGLPQPNKETLAFLILHLQRVAESPDCKMPMENLAKVFGPTIVGYSDIEPSNSNILNETAQQEQVMRRLLSLSKEFWQELLSLEMPEVFYPQLRTPEITPAPVTSRLGPIYASGHRPNKNVQIGRTPLPPRNSKYGTKTGRRQFFTSPLTK